jgi:uncharacterized repeat protein (TIGR01451 family)
MRTDTFRPTTVTAMLCGLMVIGAVSPALADINPAGCSVNGMHMTLGRTPSVVHDGDTIQYEVKVINDPAATGACQVSNVEVSFHPPGATGAINLGSTCTLTSGLTFAPGTDETFNSSTDACLAVVLNVNPGVTSASAQSQFTGILHDSPSDLDIVNDTKTVSVQVVNPSISVTKTADTPISKVGDTVNYEICVTNTGDIALENITVVDSLLGDLSSSFADTMAPGAPAECHTFSRVVLLGDPDPLVNTVTATGTDVAAGVVGFQAQTVTDTDSATVDLVQPSIDVTKTADSPVSKIGDNVNYEICVTNTGTIQLVNITVTDSLLGDLSASFADTLAVGATECHSFPRVVQAADPDPLINTVTVHANPQGLENDVTDTATATVDLVQPDVEITKTADTPISKVGDSVDYEICITNTGSVQLVNITVTDSLQGDLSGSFADSLAPTATECHTFPRTVLAGDPDPLVNTATVHANPLGLPNDITDSTAATVDLVQPEIQITKSADSTVSKAGDVVNYEICVTNTGSIQLVNVTVTDSLLGNLSASFADSLAPTQTECHVFPRTTLAGDPDPLVNTATVHSNPEGLPNDITDTASESVDLLHPAFTLSKECSPDPVAIGGTLTWTITLTNTGDVSLDIHVTDSTAGIDQVVVLAAGATQVVNATHVVTVADVSPIENTVTAEATLTGGALPNEITQTDSSSCDVEITPVGGPTRTPGYWFTHPAALLAAYECITGSQNGTITLCPGTCTANANDAMAVFWTAKGGNRPTLAQHILSAMFNECLLGTAAPPGIIQNGLDVLCNPDATSDEIAAAIAPLDAFNNSGDSLPLSVSFGPAQTKTAKSMAKAGTVPSCVED